MADTKRALASLLDLAPDNVNGLITPQDLRDMLVSAIPSDTFRVSNYGAVGDGTTDDTTAIQLAASAVATNGKGNLVFESGKTYKITASLTCNASNVRVQLNGAKIVHTGSDFAFKPGNTTSFATGLTYYTLSGTSYPAGAIVITLNSSSDNSHFSVGDYVYIRTRQTVADLTDQPIAELNQVLSIDGADITLRWPLAKDYTKDDSYTWGIANATSIVRTNWLIEGPGEINSAIRGIVGLNLVGCRVRGVKFTGRSGIHLRGRFLWVEDCDFDLTPDWSLPIWTPGFVFVDTGSADFWITRNTMRSAGLGYLHLHEGSANVWVSANTIMQPDSTNDVSTRDLPVISMRALSWNIHIQDNVIINQARDGYHGIVALQSSLYPGEGNKDLSIIGNVFSGTFSGDGILTDDDGVTIMGNKMLNGSFAAHSISSWGDNALIVGNQVPASSTTISGTGTLIQSNINITDSS